MKLKMADENDRNYFCLSSESLINVDPIAIDGWSVAVAASTLDSDTGQAAVMIAWSEKDDPRMISKAVSSQLTGNLILSSLSEDLSLHALLAMGWERMI